MSTPSTAPQPIEVVRGNVAPQEIALQYIRHEFIKLFPGQTDEFYEQMASGVTRLPSTIGEDALWKLLAGLAEGYKFKWIYRILTNDGLHWRQERISLHDIRMTGMSPFMDPILAEANWQPADFAKVWRDNPEYASHPDAAGMKPEPLRDHLPIMLIEQNGQLKVFDGMRRTCMAALANKPELTAWVGRRTKPGKGKLNADKTLFLFATYSESETKKPEDLQGLIAVSQMVIREHSNGREVVERALQFWDGRPEMHDAAAKVRAAIG
jgi:hypothetical protein